ncbi:glycoside hydrolase family 78 protein [Dinghuibacter silviterrae]|uniref:alpha-L-rhamnosidase n=1 Tax=Dinghuibacter silviterrae TaxID=1539049 RepID=A0A4R8DUM3_9BACT|nr:glycoside hydrolase family 78 protein [Dinghuibacter silviterrae]TDX00861.1 alpha-L-rhamnosidase [Dinghuibacter silviterrae]
MRKLVLCLPLLATCLAAGAQLRVTHLTCEGLSDPLGVDNLHPRLGWELQEGGRGVLQTAYEVKVEKDKKVVWETGKVASDASVYVAYAGAPLVSAQGYSWQVRVWDNRGHTSPWSAKTFWRMGLLTPSDWTAQWIVPGVDNGNAPLFRKTFQAGKKIREATLFITVHGMYEARINGQRVGDAYLAPGWTSYNKRLEYQVYDVTGLLRQGDNALGVTVGLGWFRSPLGFPRVGDHYGKENGLLAQLELTYTDGTTERIGTGDTWKSSPGSILSATIYDGETIDTRLDKTGWDKPGYDDASWSPVALRDFPKTTLIATHNEPVRKHETFTPVSVITTPKGEHVLDFGQNLVGWVVVKISGKPGDSVILSHAEVLDKAGNFYTDNLRSAKAQDSYVLRGGEQVLEPHFTFHGFRYVRLDQYPGPVRLEDFQAVALYSDMPLTGSFHCSDTMINQLQHNIQWGQKGNFLDVPTDCPQRDERLGWTGDAQVFSRTATFNRNAHNFFVKWLQDVSADQTAEGIVPPVIPNVIDGVFGSAGWADVSTIMPWNVYLAYGDTQVLRNQYPSMKAWVEYIHKVSRNDLWNTGSHFGDWLYYSPADDNDGRAAVTDKYLIAQCFYAHSTQLLIDAARVLGRTEDVATYTDLLARIKDAFMHEYVTPNGRMVSPTQTAYVLALQFDMLPESLRAQAADRLVGNIRAYNNHLTTGFLGTPYLCHVLTRFGHTDVAYQLLFQDTYPSWLYPIKMGATTIWERWDGIKTDGTFETPGMNSFNHYAYGAIGDWLYRVVSGIDTYTDAPGYKHIVIKPHPGGRLTSAEATYAVNYGTIASSWIIAGGQFTLHVTVPVNTSATVYIPASSVDAVREGAGALSASAGVTVKGMEDGYAVVEVGSGDYTFSAPR